MRLATLPTLGNVCYSLVWLVETFCLLPWQCHSCLLSSWSFLFFFLCTREEWRMCRLACTETRVYIYYIYIYIKYIYIYI
uniref:Uncharacterized protein n=1 Tax=Ixodes ricinus TaxID=34613 RepID=A0A6B0U1E8_IXORI